MFKAFGRKKAPGKEKETQNTPAKKEDTTPSKTPENATEQYQANVAANKNHGQEGFPKEPRSNAPVHEDNYGMPDQQSVSDEVKSEARPLSSQLPDYMADQNAVLGDTIPWRHGHTPDYSAANNKFKKERTHVWPPGSLEDVVSNLVKNWEKEASYKIRLEDWRTINTKTYRFSCNGGRGYTADEMMEIGTYNALIQEAAFYSAKHTSFDDSHTIFRTALPDGFPWEVTEVYSGPPVVAFKWRHWGKMTGKLVCPVGPETKLEALPTNQEVELYGVCVAHMDSDLKLSKLEIFYDPHELMASLVDARNLSYSNKPDDVEKSLQDTDFKKLLVDGESVMSDGDSFLSEDQDDGKQTLNAEDFVPPHMLRNDPQVREDLPRSRTDNLRKPGSAIGQSKPQTGNLTRSRQGSGVQGINSAVQGVQGINKQKQDGSSNSVAGLKAWQSSSKPVGRGPSNLPSDDNLLASMMEPPKKALSGSRCPFPHD